MRWGVKDENTDDHKTWDACKVELERCIVESCETFFISLQGYKYGYRPLPREIEQVRFDDHIHNKYIGSDRDELVALAKKWYVLDTNSVPMKYVLTRLDDSNRGEYWGSVLTKLLKLLTGLMFDEDLCIGDSVTNWEAVYALNKNSSTNDRVIWMKREIEDGRADADDPWKEFDDARGNADVTDRLKRLVDTMRDKLGGVSSHVHATTIDSVLSIKNKPNSAFTSYIEEFYTKMKSLLTSELDRVVQRKEAWFRDAYGSGLAGDVCADMLHHCSFARGKVLDFEGRDDLVNAAMEMIRQPSKEEGIQGSVIGQSGCGKTCFMAKLASLLYEAASVPVIIRFCGTNDGSSSGVKLLRSIIRQINFIYGLSNAAPVPEVYPDLVKHFQSLVASYPVMLLIDSIDQLTNDNQERSTISFLSGIKVHRDGRVIVSCLPDDYDSRTKSGYWYGCDRTLKEWQVPRVDIKSISNEVELILDSYLAKSSRCLSPAQRDVVLSSAAQQLDPTALFIKLAARVACSWKSTDSNCVIGNSVPLLIDQILDEVQRNYGQVLIKAVIGFITLAVNGITSQEMEDLLSLDEEVMEEVNKYNQSSRLPSHVWLRVKHELAGLLVESDQGCMRWYHRQLWETASKRYTAEEKVYYHQIMGRYFSNLVDVGIGERKGIYRQELLTKENIDPVWFRSSNAYINKRRCTEGGYHLIRGRLYVEAIDELCDLEHVCAYVKSGNGFRLVSNLVLIDRSMSVDEKREFKELSKRAYHYLRWLLKDMNFIVKDIELNVFSSAWSEPLASCAKKDLESLVKHSRSGTDGVTGSNSSCCTFNRSSWIRGRTLGGYQNFNPLMMNLIGHNGLVYSVSFSRDGTRIVSGGQDNTVRVWDAVTGEVINTLNGHTHLVLSVSFNPDGTRIVSGSLDQTIILWDAISGEVINTLTGQIGYVLSVSFSPDGTRIVSGSQDRTVRVWDAVTGKVINTLAGHSGYLRSVCFSPDGARIVSGSEDKTVRVWDTVTGEVLHTLTGHSGDVSSVHFSPDGTRIVSGSDDKTVRVWDAVTGQEINTLTGHSNTVQSVHFSRDGTRIVSGSDDKTVRVWDAVTGKVINSLTGRSDTVRSVSFSSDGTRIVSGCGDGSVRVWDAVTGQIGISDTVSTTSFSPDGSRIVSESEDNTVRVLDEVADEVSTLTWHNNGVLSVSFSPDGTRIVSGGYDKTVRVWDAVMGEVINTLTGHSGGVESVSFSPDGTRIVSGSDDETVRVWDAVTGEVINTLIGHSFVVSSVHFSADGTRIVSGSWDNTVRVWDAVTGQVINTLTGHSGDVRSVSFSPDGTRLVSGSEDKTVRVWNAVTGEVIHILNGHSDTVQSVHFSPDGTRIVSGGYENSVRVWDAVTGEVINTLIVSRCGIHSVSFSPDGTCIVSGSRDKTVILWDAVTGQVINTLTGHSGNVFSASFSPDGTRIVSGSLDNIVMLWDSVTDRSLRLTVHSGRNRG